MGLIGIVSFAVSQKSINVDHYLNWILSRTYAQSYIYVHMYTYLNITDCIPQSPGFTGLNTVFPCNVSVFRARTDSSSQSARRSSLWKS